MTLITTFLTSLYQDFYHHVFLPLLPHLRLFLTTHFTPLSLTLQVLLTALSFHFLPFNDVVASLFLFYAFNPAILFTLATILSFLFPLELYEEEVEFIVSCRDVGLRTVEICTSGVKSLVRRIHLGVHIFCSAAIEAARDVQKLWVQADLGRGIKASWEWFVKNEFISDEVTAAVEAATPIEAESKIEVVIESVMPPPPVKMHRPPPVKERPPPRCPSPFKSSSRSSFSGGQRSRLYRKSSDYYKQHDSKNCLTVVNRASIWDSVPADRGRKKVPVDSCAVVAAKPIIDVVTPKPMIKKTENMASMGKPVTVQESPKELAGKTEDAATESLKGVERLPVKLHIVHNIAIGCVPAEHAREKVITQDKEEGEVKDLGVKKERGERAEDPVEQARPKEEEVPIQIKGTTGLQKIETQKHSTAQAQVNKAIIAEGGIKFIECLIIHINELEKVSTEVNQGGGFVTEGNTVVFNSPISGVLGPRTAAPDVAISKDHHPTAVEVTTVPEVATTSTLPVSQALDRDTVAGSSTSIEVTSATGAATTVALPTSEVLDRDSVIEISGCPIVEVTSPISNIEVLTPVWVCGVVKGLESVFTPELSRSLYVTGVDHVTHMQDVFLPTHIVEDESLGDTTEEMEQCEELDPEVTGDKDEEMIDGWDVQAVGDEEMEEAPLDLQMIDKAQLFYEDHNAQEDTMDDISYTSENSESQEMEIEESRLEIISSQEMEIEEIGLEATSGQEMEIEETGPEVISIQSFNIGASQHQSFSVTPFMVAPVCYFPSTPIHDILLESIFAPSPVFAPGLSDPLTACQVVSDPTSGSITHTATSPTTTYSIPLVPDLATVQFAPALAPDVSNLAAITAIPGDQVPVTSVQIATPTITTVPAFLLASEVTTESAPTLSENQHSKIATASSSSTPIFQRHHESVTVTTAVIDETPTSISDDEVVRPEIPGNILKTQYETIAVETQAPTAAETPVAVETPAVIETPAPVGYWKENIASSSQISSPRRQYQAATSSTLMSYTSPQHVETSTASSSRVPTPKRRFEPDATSRDDPAPKKVARIIAPLRKSIDPITPIKPINVPTKPSKDVKGKGKVKAIETEEIWSDDDDDAFDDMGIDPLRDTSAEEERLRRDYYIKTREG